MILKELNVMVTCAISPRQGAYLERESVHGRARYANVRGNVHWKLKLCEVTFQIHHQNYPVTNVQQQNSFSVNTLVKFLKTVV